MRKNDAPAEMMHRTHGILSYTQQLRPHRLKGLTGAICLWLSLGLPLSWYHMVLNLLRLNSAGRPSRLPEPAGCPAAISISGCGVSDAGARCTAPARCSQCEKIAINFVMRKPHIAFFGLKTTLSWKVMPAGAFPSASDRRRQIRCLSSVIPKDRGGKSREGHVLPPLCIRLLARPEDCRNVAEENQIFSAADCLSAFLYSAFSAQPLCSWPLWLCYWGVIADCI